jgi:UDP-2-acetamido-2,6-beta-L-arabino-hexul-4-ose reductase
MNVVITGAGGFLGTNLAVRLAELQGVVVHRILRDSTSEQLSEALARADFIFHLAGVNRPTDAGEFETGNAGFTSALVDAIDRSGRRIPVLYSSSTQAQLDNPYGRSKQRAEEALFALSRTRGVPVFVLRLPNVFGKWSRPNYNSAVATFCHNVARGLPINVDPTSSVTLAYVDDVVDTMIRAMRGELAPAEVPIGVEPTYTIRVRDLADQILAFRNCRTTLVGERVGTGLVRALYATYVSFLPTESFAYPLPKYGDARGVFVEMLKTHDSGQFSFFTAHPGVTRGGHYHHTKTEKFLVVKGKALFKFRHLMTGELVELETSGAEPTVVETIPGWAHDITNVGAEEMIVMLWANEIFDRAKPDTVARALK